MKSALPCAVIAAAIAFAAPVQAAENFLPIAEATGRLNGNCSAQVIYSEFDKVKSEVVTLVLTAKHCVTPSKDGDTQRLEFAKLDPSLSETGSVIYLADVAGRSANADVALLRLREKAKTFPAKIELDRTPKLTFGEVVYTLGYPGGNTLTVTPGQLGVRERNPVSGEEREYLRATPGIIGGNSGGGLYHVVDGKLKLIGLTTAGRRDATFYGLYTPVEDIVAYLKVAAPEVLK